MKKTLTTFLSALLIFSATTSMAEALSEKTKEPQIISIKATTSEPVNIYVSAFDKDEPHILKGQIISEKILKPITSIEFSISGKNHEILWKESFPWENTFQKKNGKVVINFEHDLKKNRITGTNTLSLRLFGTENEIIAIKNKKISFPKDTEDPLSEISNIKTKKSENIVSVNIDFLNKGESNNFYAKVDVYKDPKRTKKIKELKTDLIPLENLKTKTFSIEFPKPDTPQFYVTDAQIFDSKDKAQSGILSSGFLIDGLFGLIEFSDINPKKFLSPGENANIKVKGTINTYTKGLTVLIAARTKENDTQNESQFFKSEMPITIDKYRNFAEVFPIPVKWETTQIWADIKIKKGNQILSETSISSKKHIAPDDFLSNIISNPVEALGISKASRLKIIIGGSIAVLFLILLITLIMKIIKKKKTLSIILLAFSFYASGVNAAAIVSPIFEYYRTTNLPSGEPFNEVTVEGEITGGGGILNISENYTTSFIMERAEDTQALTVAGEAFVVTEVDKFFVTFDAADAKLALETNVLDSDYTISRIDLTNTGTSAIIQIDVNLQFNITNENPKARFELKNVGGAELLDPTGIDFNDLHSNGVIGDASYYITNPVAFLTDVIQKYFTNDSITAKIYCGTSDTRAGIGTNPASDTSICASDSPHLEEVNIRGNFCNDGMECDSSGARTFKICNLTGNCATALNGTDIVVKNFDNKAPQFGNSEISNGDNPTSPTYKRTNASPLAAIENYIFKVFNTYDEEAIDNTTIHSNACGVPSGAGMTDYDDYFYEKTETGNQICHPKQIPCSISSYQRGVREYTSNGGGTWSEIPELSLVCAQQCAAGETAVFCSPDDEILNGGDGVKRCCSSSACSANFPLCLPFSLQ